MDRLRVVFALSSLLFASCNLSHGLESPPDGGAPADTGPLADAPRVCEVSPLRPELDLVPLATNPASCSTSIPCMVWFGHGQHLACPPRGAPASPIEVECNIWDCLCEDGAGFVADFSTGEVLDAREGTSCRYRIVMRP